MNHCKPIRHVKADIIQLGSGQMYRVTDWDGYLYDVVMQYADQCNNYIIERLMTIGGGLLLIIPGAVTDLIGVAIIAVVVALQLRAKKAAKA